MDDRDATIDRLLEKHWGKYRGIVRDRDDPERLGRLKLLVPSLLGDAITGWAFPASPYAGAGLGFFFVPQLDDLVWVEFAEGELEHPLWTGCSWAKPAGNTEIPKEAQLSYPDCQVLKTKSGSVIVFNDATGQEQIIVRGREGCEITIDPNANLVTVTAATVLIQSAAGIPQELATKSFVKETFDKHVHATGVGPSGPPIPLSSANPLCVTSVLKAE